MCTTNFLCDDEPCAGMGGVCCRVSVADTISASCLSPGSPQAHTYYSSLKHSLTRLFQPACWCRDTRIAHLISQGYPSANELKDTFSPWVQQF